MRRLFAVILLLVVAGAGAPRVAVGAPESSTLRMVVVISRHGVRSPTHPAELQPYANRPWPVWQGHPGNLTTRGAVLMRQFGAYYRRLYGPMLGLAPNACPPSDAVFIWADVDQRTKATGAAVSGGFAPGCGIAVGHAPADPDPLFDPLPGVGSVDKAESLASVLGSIGGSFDGIVDANGAAFATLERVLGCVPPATCKQISQIPTTVSSAGDGGLASLDGGLDMAADVAENMLLEYTDGHRVVGWGRVDRATLLQLLQLHVLAKRLEHGSRYTARAHSSNIMAHVLQTLAEGVTGSAVSGTRVPPQARFVFFAGHDTQLAELSGMFGLSWLVKGDQMDDTPPDLR